MNDRISTDRLIATARKEPSLTRKIKETWKHTPHTTHTAQRLGNEPRGFSGYQPTQAP